MNRMGKVESVPWLRTPTPVTVSSIVRQMAAQALISIFDLLEKFDTERFMGETLSL